MASSPPERIFASIPGDECHRRPRDRTGRSQIPYQQEESMSEHILHVTDASFKSEVLDSPVPVLVDYWAEWCGPCKMIAPILDEVGKEYAGKLKVAKLNIDDNPKTPGEYGIRGIPTLILFKGGNVEATKVGALSKSQLTAFIDSNL
jgi:thioredoxin 1